MAELPTEELQVDPSRWDDLADSLGESLAEIVESYLEDTPEKIIEMRECLGQDNYETVSRLAHSLKSSSGIFGARYMIALCLDLERAAGLQETGCEAKIEAVQVAYNSLSAELQARMAAFNP